MPKQRVHYAKTPDADALRGMTDFSLLEFMVVSNDTPIKGGIYFERLDSADDESPSIRVGNCVYTLIKRLEIYDIAPKLLCFSVGREEGTDIRPITKLDRLDPSVSRQQGVIIVARKVLFNDFNNGNGVYAVTSDYQEITKVNGRFIGKWNPEKHFIGFGIPPEENAGTKFERVPRFRLRYALLDAEEKTGEYPEGQR